MMGEVVLVRCGGGKFHGAAMAATVIVIFSLYVFLGFGSSISCVRVVK